MDARLTQAYLAQRTAASNVVAGALVPKGATSTVRSATSAKDTTSTTSATGTSDITSSDFLTLLVSELQNQDPTQPTDPNEYITQLAQVNSLEQLISINSGISTLDSSVSTTTSTAGTSVPALAVTTAPVVASAVPGGANASDLHPASAPASSPFLSSAIHKHQGAAAQ